MLRVTLRGVRAHAVRFGLSVLAVTLGVAFVAGTFALRTMMSDTFHGIVDATAPADAYVQGADEVAGGGSSMGMGVGPQRNPVPVDLADRLGSVDGVRTALADVSGSIVLVGADGTAVQSTQAPSMGVAFDERDPVMTLTDGRVPVGDHEVALETATLESSGLAVGDATRVVLDGQVRDVDVVGAVDLGGPMAGATIVLLPVDVARAVYAPDGTVATISVFGDEGLTEAELAAVVQRALDADPLGASARAVPGQDLRDEVAGDIDAMLGFVTSFLLIFAVISLFVGGYLISNTFTMSVRQRVREFALLRALGASPVQVFAVVVGQAAVVGLVGSALGVLAGLGLVSLLRVGFEQMGMDLVGDIPVDPTSVVLCLVLGTLVSAVAAAVPARRAALVAPVEAMRGEVTVPERSLRLRGALGGAVVALGAGAVLWAALRPADAAAEPLLGIGAGVVLVGVLVAAPSLARAVLRVLALPFVRTLPPVGRLAQGNVVRNPRRTAATAGALVIGMALVGGVSVIAATGQGSLAKVVESSTDADLVLRSATSMIPAGAVTDVEGLPQVGRADAIAYTIGGVSPAPGQRPGASDAGTIGGFGDGVVGGVIAVEVVDGDPAALDDTHAVVNTYVVGDDWAVGDRITVTTPVGSRDLTVAAVVESRVLGTSVLVTRDLLDVLAPGQAQTIDTVFVDAAPGTTPDELRSAITDVVAPYVVVSVQDRDEFVDQMAAQVDQILVVLYALLGLSLVIAVLGIVNTLALSVIERTREIGLLRAVGLGRLQLAGVVTVESVLTAVFGTLLGLAVGVGLASVMPRVYAEEGLDTLVVPWDGIALMVGLAVVVGVLAALWPGARAARLRVLDAIATPD